MKKVYLGHGWIFFLKLIFLIGVLIQLITMDAGVYRFIRFGYDFISILLLLPSLIFHQKKIGFYLLLTYLGIELSYRLVVNAIYYINFHDLSFFIVQMIGYILCTTILIYFITKYYQKNPQIFVSSL